MRPGQHQNNKRMRGRNRGGKGPNPLNRSYESNGPDVKIRGSAQHIAEKYLQLARDAQASGDRVMGENYMQHAEHYFRLLAAAQAQFAPHLPAYVRPDEQALDDEEDFEAEGPVEGAPGEQQPGVPVPQQGQGGYQQPGGEQQQQQPRREREYRPRWERGGDRQDRQDRYERGERGDRYERRDRQDRFQAGAPAELGEQPSVEFPERPREQAFEPRGPRPERGPRPDRPPRPERSDVAPAEAANGEAVPDAPAVESEEGREPGLPSFLTRGRRRGRPPYRRREEGEAAEGGESAVSEESNGAAVPPPAVTS